MVTRAFSSAAPAVEHAAGDVVLPVVRQRRVSRRWRATLRPNAIIKRKRRSHGSAAGLVAFQANRLRPCAHRFQANTGPPQPTAWIRHSGAEAVAQRNAPRHPAPALPIGGAPKRTIDHAVFVRQAARILNVRTRRRHVRRRGDTVTRASKQRGVQRIHRGQFFGKSSRRTV